MGLWGRLNKLNFFAKKRAVKDHRSRDRKVLLLVDEDDSCVYVYFFQLKHADWRQAFAVDFWVFAELRCVVTDWYHWHLVH